MDQTLTNIEKDLGAEAWMPDSAHIDSSLTVTHRTGSPGQPHSPDSLIGFAVRPDANREPSVIANTCTVQ